MDPDLHSEEEIRLSQLQLKIDGQNARQEIEDIRESSAEPEMYEEGEVEDFVDDAWLDNLDMEVEALTGLEFDLGNGNSFTYGLDDSTRTDSYEVNSLEDILPILISVRMVAGITTLSIRTELYSTTLMPSLSAAYRQGQSDGQKGLVQKAANVS